MAGERRGKLLEALVVEAVRPALPRDHHLYWDQPRPGMAVRPDLLICDGDDTAALLIQVTWSMTQQDLRPVKYWRDFAEYNALRRRESARAALITAVRSDRRCTKLQRAAELAWDRVLCLAELGSGATLVGWLEAAVAQLEAEGHRPSFSTLLLAELERARADQPPLDQALDELGRQLTALLARDSSASAGLWSVLLPRQRQLAASARSPGGICSWLRAGFAELVSFDTDERAALYAHAFRDEPLRLVPAHAEIAGLIEGPTLQGYRLGSEPLRWCLSHLGSAEAAEALIALDRTERRAYVAALREAGDLRAAARWIERNLDRLTDPSALEEALRQCFAGSLPIDGSPSSTHWLYGSCKHLLSSLGHGQGWLPEVCRETGCLRSVLSGQVLPRLERLEALPNDRVMTAIAHCFARRLSSVTRQEVRSATERAVDRGVRLLLRNRLQCHGVDPLGALIRQRLPSAQPARLGSALVMQLRSSCREAGFTRNDLCTSGLLAGQSFIKWQSAYGTGNARHKSTELAGRAAHLVIDWDPEAGFHLRRQPERLVLLLDGTWSRRDLELLTTSGWSTILAPDELDELSAIC